MRLPGFAARYSAPRLAAGRMAMERASPLCVSLVSPLWGLAVCVVGMMGARAGIAAALRIERALRFFESPPVIFQFPRAFALI